MKLTLGALLALVATILINYASFLQKRQLDYLPRIGSESTMKTIRAFLACRPWLGAQGMQIGGTFLHTIAVGYLFQPFYLAAALPQFIYALL